MVRWIIFDLDDTLLLNQDTGPAIRAFNDPITPVVMTDNIRLTLYPDTLRVLQFLKSRNIPIAMASFRTNAEEVLTEFGLLKYFKALEYGQDGRTKVTMIQQLGQRLNLDPQEAVFYDDLHENVELCNNNLIYTIKVNPHVGVTMEQLFNGLSAIQSQPLYIFNQSNVKKTELAAYFPDFRVVYLSHGGGARDISSVMRIASNRKSLVLKVTNHYDLELHTETNIFIVHTADLYHGIDEILIKYDAIAQV